MQSANKKIKLSCKQEEDMKKPLSKINEDPEHYRTRFSGPVVYDEVLSQINVKDVPTIDWEKKGVVCKPGNALANYQPSATAIAFLEKERAAAIAIAERERVAKRTAEEAFNEVFALKKSIRELEGIFNFLNFI